MEPAASKKRMLAMGKEPRDLTVETLKKLCCNGQSEEVLAALAVVEPGKWLEKCSDGNTPLHVAVVKGHLEIFELIIDRCRLVSLQVSSATGFAGRTLLHQACKGGCIKLVKILIDNFKSNLKAEDAHHYTPMHLAALNGHKELVALLVSDYKCSTGPVGTRALALLHLACLGGHIDLVGTLIKDFGAEIDAKDSYSNTPVTFAVQRGHSQVVDSLINYFKCNPYIRGYKNRTLLHQACLCGHLQLVRTFVTHHKFRIKSRDGSSSKEIGDAPICLAAKRGHQKIVVHLIERYHCDPDITGRKEKTLLHYACEGGHFHLACTLITDYKLDLDLRDRDGNSPLHLGMKHHHSAMVYDLLTKFPIDLTVTNSQGRTVLDLARKYGDVRVMEYLMLIKLEGLLRNDDKDGIKNWLQNEGRDLLVSMHHSCIFATVKFHSP